jgi:Na+/proline symporter
MILKFIDWLIIGSFFLLSLVIGLYASKRAGKSTAEFFLSGRNMPWWLLGISMVATTFSCDTPNLVTDLVRQHGVAGNWAWWAFLLTGMLTVFVYAGLWRRSGVMTDLEFYELRYSGKMASFLRGFRALYLGAFFNMMVIALVSLALIKIGAVMLQWPAWKTLIIASAITLIYSTLGGLTGVILTDFFQFIIAMVGAVGAAIIVLRLPGINSLHELLQNPEVSAKINLLPDFTNNEALITLLILPIAVQWWSVWYPGAEPGGGGYIAQRMLSAKNEKGAIKATLLFNILHYAFRPWPWIIVALASLVIFPDLDSLARAFPHIDSGIIRHDLAYPAMLSFLPAGFIGLVVASLIAAFMSTVATQLNWGASYVVNDFYRRFLNNKASEKTLVRVGRITTVLLMFFSALLALLLSNALQAFQILLQIGAGTGLIFILRWFWWRINGYSELSAMIISFVIALYFQFIHPLTSLPEISSAVQLVIGVAVTTLTWLLVTWLTPPENIETLTRFHKLIRAGGPGWKKVVAKIGEKEDHQDMKEPRWEVPRGILCMVIGCLLVYSTLFATGYWIYGNITPAIILTAVVIVSVFLLFKVWKR